MKKKRFLILFSLILLFLAACNLSGDNQVDASFTGTVEEINDDSAIVAIEEGEILNSGGRAVVDLSLSEETIEVGDEVRVGYEGSIAESYPLQINTVFVEKMEDE